MAIWIQSLSWTLLYSLAQGLVVYASLSLVFKLVPIASANAKYHLSLSALTVLFAWFVATWWRQFHSLSLLNEQVSIAHAQNTIIIQPSSGTAALGNYGIYNSVLSSFRIIAPWLSVCYVAGVVLMLARLSLGMSQLFSLGKKGLQQPGVALEGLLASLKTKLQLKGSVRLFVSVKAQVPMVIGFLKPIVLMPAATIAQLSTAQLETIILHELAHIKRHDYLVNILQTIVETIIFFNPFIWMISAVIRREREHCCDDLVLDHTGEPLSYATALAALATAPATVSAFTVAASGKPTYLLNRIKRIMEMKKNPFSYSRMAAAIIIIGAITCATAVLTPSFARYKKSVPGDVTTTKAKPEVIDSTSANNKETNDFIGRLVTDHLVDQVNGFTVEKKGSVLIINGQPQSNEVSAKYLSAVKQDAVKVQVFSLQDRIKMHPDAGFLQLLLPMTLSAPCVDYTPKKPGC